jgi:RNA polymerase sigma-70 factor, ECF subfamily
MSVLAAGTSGGENAGYRHYLRNGKDDSVMRVERSSGTTVTTQEGQRRKPEFTAYLSAAQARLYGYIHSLIADINDADDLYQQTALVLWNKFAEFDRSRDFFAWACGVARGEVANFARRRARQRLYLAADVNLLLVEAHAEFTDAEQDDRRVALSRCVEKLPPADRELLVECYREPDGVHAAAGRRSRSPHSVYNSLRRIRKALFDCVNRVLARGPGHGGM